MASLIQARNVMMAIPPVGMVVLLLVRSNSAAMAALIQASNVMMAITSIWTVVLLIASVKVRPRHRVIVATKRKIV